MPSLLSSSTDSASSKKALDQPIPLPGSPDDVTNPLQIALRTYAVALSLSLGPSLIPFITVLASPRSTKQANKPTLSHVLRHELGPTGLAFASTVAVGGGVALQRAWNTLEDFVNIDDSKLGIFTGILHKLRIWTSSLKLSDAHKTFLCNLLCSCAAISLLQTRRRPHRLQSSVSSIRDGIQLPSAPSPSRYFLSPTLDLTVLLFVRAADSVVQSVVFKRSESDVSRLVSMTDMSSLGTQDFEKEWESKELKRRRRVMTTRIDALVFWACSARIMWCFFYEPHRLPRSYVKWITSLANVDQRLVNALRALRAGDWSYIRGSTIDLTSFSRDLGYPASWGDPALVPAYGGPIADKAWKALGVHSRKGLGGVPCELVHGGVAKNMGLPDSCTSNAAVRGAYAFLEAIAIYIPAHFLPILLTHPRSVLRLHRIIPTFISVLRSAAFLSAFLSSYFLSVCLTRTLVLAKLFPWISHDFWDGPYGCVMAGSVICGGSIWIENGKRRGEMALYVLPRALGACLPGPWIMRHYRGFRIVERLVFILSLSSLLTAAVHRPGSLRGLSRWTLAFVMKGPNAGFWKRKRQSPSILPTPAEPSSFLSQSSDNSTSHSLK